MSAVENKQWLSAEYLQAGRPLYLPQAGSDGVFRDVPAPLPKSFHRLQDHRRVADLMRSEQGELVFPAPPGKDLSVQILPEHLCGKAPRADKGNIVLRADRAYDGGDLGCAVIADAGAAGFDDTGLGGRNLFKGVSKIFRVFQADVGDDGDLRCVDCVGAVERAAHPYLQHDNVTALLVEIFHGDGGHQLKLTGMILHRVGHAADTLRDGGEGLAGDVLSVHLYPLTKVLNVRGNVQPHPVSRPAEDGVEHGAGASLAVAAGDMDKFQFFLGVAQLPEQLLRALQSQPGGAPALVFDIENRLLLCHGQAPR